MISQCIAEWDQALAASAMELSGSSQISENEALRSADAFVVAELAALLCAYCLPTGRAEPDHYPASHL
jgi:hypothetical protein